MSNSTSTAATITLYADPDCPGLAWKTADDSGPAGPDRDDTVSKAELREALIEDLDAAVAALANAGLLIDTDDSRYGFDAVMLDVDVTDAAAAARILNAL
jgi:hypothetical protein